MTNHFLCDWLFARLLFIDLHNLRGPHLWPNLSFTKKLTERTPSFETFLLQENRITIGSDDDNHLILESPDVDLMHASLELRENLHWFLQDLGGASGTGVNGYLIEGPYMLHHNDVIELGVIKLRFQTDDERGITEEFPMQDEADVAEVDSGPNVKAAQPDIDGEMSGRVWFTGVGDYNFCGDMFDFDAVYSGALIGRNGYDGFTAGRLTPM